MEFCRAWTVQPRYQALLFHLFLLTSSVSAQEDDVHIAVLTDCQKNADWQTVGVAFTHKLTEQPGQMTRVMCCREEFRANYSKTMLQVMPTYFAPDYAWIQKQLTGDWCATYNKPGGILDWIQKATPKEHWVLAVDGDTLFLKQFRPQDFPTLAKGWVISAAYSPLIGVVQNELWSRHIPDVPAYNDTLGGLYGRHADMVGGFHFAHRDDLARIAPMWLNLTRAVRHDPEAWRLSGDKYVEKGGKPWLGEMYGYAFAAAKANVRHVWDIHTQFLPGMKAAGIPLFNHYAYAVQPNDKYNWYKRDHTAFDIELCPPWDLSNPPNKHGIFEPPPRPEGVKSRSDPPTIQYYTDLLGIETVATLNAAFCDFHLRHCPPSSQLLDVCTEVLNLYLDIIDEINRVEPHVVCQDYDDKCPFRAASGECVTLLGYTKWYCAKSCGFCTEGYSKRVRPTRRRIPTDTLELLSTLSAKLTGDDEVAGDSHADDGDTAGANILPASRRHASFMTTLELTWVILILAIVSWLWRRYRHAALLVSVRLCSPRKAHKSQI